MDRFELTPEEIAHKMPAGEIKLDQKFPFAKVIANAQVAKVLSLLEPVELEALGDREIDEAKGVFIAPTKEEWAIKPDHTYWQDKRITQATISYNQSHGQLYRLKEVS